MPRFSLVILFILIGFEHCIANNDKQPKGPKVTDMVSFIYFE